MKRGNLLLLIALLLITGCQERKSDSNQADDLFTIDVTTTYPKKELILQDFMDVEYIPLESKDEFVTTGWLHYIGKEIIVVRNRHRTSDGDIFIFDRKGKGLRKINRIGHGAEEYQFLLGITVDEDNNELFVNDHATRRILVYDLEGQFKRNFAHKDGSMYDMGFYNFGPHNLICRDIVWGDNGIGNENNYLIISKKDGSLVKEIVIPYEEKVQPEVYTPNGKGVMTVRNRTLIPDRGNSFMVMESSSDTIFRLKTDYSLTPIIIRTPPIRSMSPGVFLYPAVYTDRYCFMQTVKAEWDWERNTGHERINLIYDKQEDSLFEYVLYNADIDDDKSMILTSEIPFGNDEIAVVLTFEADELIEYYENGKLKGQLKDIAAELDEDSNPVLMLIKYKK